MGGNRWEWMGVDGSGWEWMGVGRSEWDEVRVNGSGWEWVEVAGAWLSKTHNKIYLDIFRKNKKTE